MTDITVGEYCVGTDKKHAYVYILPVYISCGLVHHKDHIMSEHSPGQAEQLSLTNAEVRSTFSHVTL